MSATVREARMIEQPGGKKRASPHPVAAYAGPRSCAPPGRSPAACARSRRGRRVPAPTARAMRAVCPGHVARKRCERLKGARNAPRRTAPLATPGLPPAPAPEVWRAAALQNVFVSPGFAGRAGSLRPWAQTFLTPAAARRAGGKAAGEVGGRRTPGGKDRRQPSFSAALIAVCRSSPRCPR